jgi:hypothetical protein
MNGGPAFPIYPIADSRRQPAESQFGMSLRDYFAAHEISTPPLTWWQSRVGSHIEKVEHLKGVELSEGLARWRFQVADAMLEARK